MPRLSALEESRLMEAVRAADAPLDFRADAEAFARMLAMEPEPQAHIEILRPRPGRMPRLVYAGAAAVALFAGTALAAAQQAGPGGALYAVKLASEKIWVSTAWGAISEARRHLDLADRRAQEAEGEAQLEHRSRAEQLVNEARDEIAAARALIAGSSDGEAGGIRERAAALDVRLDRILEELAEHDRSAPEGDDDENTSAPAETDEEHRSPGTGDEETTPSADDGDGDSVNGRGGEDSGSPDGGDDSTPDGDGGS